MLRAMASGMPWPVSCFLKSSGGTCRQARTVLPRLFRALLAVEEAVKEMPDDAVLADHPDLPAIRRRVAAALVGRVPAS
ncbi:hypothetical protein SAMN05216251_103391 [Actinacidiphila alni]|uniref:Uncharacterized protein n=1 Tax=Actinacidiphila alni TaxID=380248 RepID=A0A1I2B7Y0_9ACTN|nr:hypothetical protein [Actinacidiphila alni]SFE52312.1 hypothetical protein SAMN05216251_103391 [Actinacidiphila alni]